MTFKENGFFVVRNFLDIINVDLDFLQDYMYLKCLSGDSTKGDDIAVGGKSFYSDYLMETILKRSTNVVGEIINYNLLPTYSFTRMYVKGNELKKHRDRPSCEISFTLGIGIPSGEEINPIYMAKNENESDAVALYLNPGDICIYKGCDMWHWRPPFKNKWYIQSFLHYVDANGPYTDYIYDTRPNLGYPEQYKKI